MSAIKTSKIDQSMPAVVGFITILAVAILGFQFFETTLEMLIGGGLLLAFTILYLLMPAGRDTAPWKAHLYMATMTAIVSMLLLMQPRWGVFPMLFFVLSPIAMMIFPQRTGMLWLGIFTMLTALIFFALAPPWEAFMVWLAFTAGYWFFGAFARALANAEDARQESQRLLSELQKTHHQLQEYAARVEELAVIEERNRLAREMHDTLGHRLTVSAVQLEGAQKLISRNSEQAAEMINTVRVQVREALAELRATVATLREPFEADLPITISLQRLASSFEQATALHVHLNLPRESPALPGAHRLALYRAAQEALTNVQRHAQAQQVWIDFTAHTNSVVLTISDDGVGFASEVKEAAFGLRGMRERAIHLDGELFLESREGGGAQIKIILPLVEEIKADGDHSTAAGGRSTPDA